MTQEIDRSRQRLSGALAVAAGLLTLVVVALWSSSAAAVALGGLALVLAGVTRGSVAAVVAGSLVLFGGVIVAGLADAGPVWLLVGTLGAVLAWDFGEQAVTLGQQVGRHAATARGELVHAGVSLAVGVASVGVVALVFSTVDGGFHVGALVVLLVAALVLVSAIRP
ncbi:hypothetical protein BRC81_09245 [Halobacteriales archaeon QS_1_68_20]|nr:MAG: hypothetical protein BRC81_09245 [Halobacteriales archaeon QS_1_68_20]